MKSNFFLSFPIFANFTELLCAFSTRQGGVSQNPFDSLNLGMRTADNSVNVQKNRKIFFRELNIDADKVAYPDQIHSAHVKVARRAKHYNQTDALIFSGHNLFLSIQTADCFPIFIYIPGYKTGAVIHAGWRGVVCGIIENTLNRLTIECNAGAENYIVAIGPGLQSECFEVRADVYNKIPVNFVRPHRSPEHKYLDLRAWIVEKLLLNGVLNENIYRSELCTKCKSDLFYSHRRDGINSGRMMGIIGLR